MMIPTAKTTSSGVDFIDENGGGAGVRLGKSGGRKSPQRNPVTSSGERTVRRRAHLGK
jgi:hypothetical protein